MEKGINDKEKAIWSDKLFFRRPLGDTLLASLTADRCLGRDLCSMGFAVVEQTKQIVMVITTVTSKEEGYHYRCVWNTKRERC